MAIDDLAAALHAQELEEWLDKNGIQYTRHGREKFGSYAPHILVLLDVGVEVHRHRSLVRWTRVHCDRRTLVGAWIRTNHKLYTLRKFLEETT